MRLWVAVLALVSTVFVSGCGAGDGGCDHPPVTGTIAYTSPSTPPPYHFEWTLDLGADRSRITLSPGYGSTLTWTSDFTPVAAEVARTCHDLAAASDDRPGPTGGGTLQVDLAGSAGRRIQVTTSDTGAADQARAMVPPANWNEVDGAYQTWKAGELAKK